MRYGRGGQQQRRNRTPGRAHYPRNWIPKSGSGWPGWLPSGVGGTVGTRTSSGTRRLPAFVLPTGSSWPGSLGHSSAVTSEIYAEIDGEKANEVMEKLG